MDSKHECAAARRAEAVAAILRSQSAVLGQWIPSLTHRGCSTRAHLEGLADLLHNVTAERFYVPLPQAILRGFEETAVTLVLDTRMLWEQFCLVEGCLAGSGRSLTWAQVVLKHGSATVGFKDYRQVSEAAQAVLPTNCQVTFLADRGFQHRELRRWLQPQEWQWARRVKSDLQFTLALGKTRTVVQLLSPQQQAYLFETVTVWDEWTGHLATAHVPIAGDAWAVLSDRPPSLQTFAPYDERFGGVELHFKDYKSAAFEMVQSGLREALHFKDYISKTTSQPPLRWCSPDCGRHYSSPGCSCCSISLLSLPSSWGPYWFNMDGGSSWTGTDKAG